ncbi:MAG: right-handed parallel beta-helix repeat-containing protein [Sneathiella sp.]|uniref:right-handed parallel beta-helix repeat-containing protein n=1 Tax=Sneathiella sp. TaxID=1964365 RepID=UPI0030017A6E
MFMNLLYISSIVGILLMPGDYTQYSDISTKYSGELIVMSTEISNAEKIEDGLLLAAAEKLGAGTVNIGKDPSLFNLTDFTISATFELNSINDGKEGILWNHTQYGILVDQNDLIVNLRGIEGDIRVRDVIDQAGWHDVQVVHSQETGILEFFVDGKSVYSEAVEGIDIGGPSHWDVELGNAFDKPLDGQVANFSVHNEAVPVDSSLSIYDRMLELDQGSDVSGFSMSGYQPDPDYQPGSGSDTGNGTDGGGDSTNDDANDPTPPADDDVADSGSGSSGGGDNSNGGAGTPTPPVDDDVADSGGGATGGGTASGGADMPPLPTTVIEVGSTAELLQALSNNTSGDVTIKLLPGDYIGVSIKDMHFTDDIVITSADPDNPARMADLDVRNSANISFADIDFKVNNPGEAGIFVAWVRDSEDINFFNNVFDGGTDEIRDGDTRGLSITRSTGSIVSGNEFTSLTRGANFDHSSDFTVSNNTLHNIRSDGFNFITVDGANIDGNTFLDFYPADGDHPDYIQFWTQGETVGSSNVTIQNNFMAQSGGGEAQAIFIRDEAGVGYSNFVIQNNVIYQSTYHGITANGIDGLAIENNTVLSTVGSKENTLWIQVTDSNNVEVHDNIATRMSYDNEANYNTSGNISTELNGKYGSNYEDLFAQPLDAASNNVEDFIQQDGVNIGADIQAIINNSSTGGVGQQGSNTTGGNSNTPTDVVVDTPTDGVDPGNVDTILLTGSADSDIFDFSQTTVGSTGQGTKYAIDGFGSGDKISFEGIGSGSIEFLGGGEFYAQSSQAGNENWSLDNIAENFGSGEVSIGQDASLFDLAGDFTMSVTFELADLTSGKQALLYTHTNYGLYVQNDDLVFEFRQSDGSGNSIRVKDAIDNAGWNDVQVVHDAAAGTLEFWVNGESVYSGSDKDIEIQPASYWDALAGGAGWGGKQLNGQIADVSVINEALDIDGSQTTVARTVSIDNLDDNHAFDHYAGNTQITFDEPSQVLSVDFNGDQNADMEIELIGVSLSDLHASDFLA